MKDLISMGLKSMQASDAGGRRHRGFTLIELMVTMVIASIVMAAIFSVYAALTRSYTTQNAAAGVQQAVRATIDFIAEDIMMAGLTNPEKDYGGTAMVISYAGSIKISFNLDRDMDGDTDGKTPPPDVKDISENITYELIGNQLWITDDLGGEPLIDNIINNRPDIDIPLFRYYKENDTDTPALNDLTQGKDLIDPVKGYDLGNPLGADDRMDIRTVEICVIVEEPAGREGMIQRTYTTRVRRRNVDI
jgi:prepilin-type N-terminal cleavage/methylation domain-containing protein